jgi:superfamily I DNA and/or RNA helicase
VFGPGDHVSAGDRFQGQVAAVVLISMVTSSGDDLMRQIEFLYSHNRLNIAISRARCLRWLARAVYKTNDRRAAVKRRINELAGSALIEEKYYSPPGPEVV